MGLEGAVRLGFRRELEAIEDPQERQAAFDSMVEAAYRHGQALNMAAHLEIDDVIDPAETRDRVLHAFRFSPLPTLPPSRARNFLSDSCRTLATRPASLSPHTGRSDILDRGAPGPRTPRPPAAGPTPPFPPPQAGRTQSTGATPHAAADAPLPTGPAPPVDGLSTRHPTTTHTDTTRGRTSARPFPGADAAGGIRSAARGAAPHSCTPPPTPPHPTPPGTPPHQDPRTPQTPTTPPGHRPTGVREHAARSLCNVFSFAAATTGEHAMAHDLVIRNGRVVDGTGEAARIADVAIDDGIVTAVGVVDGTGTEELDADGAVVAPGWVDVHSHYDGQATWDQDLGPSSWHGVTTLVMGNCGVGFALRPGPTATTG